MDYIEFKLWNAGLLVFAAFVWGLYCGLTGRHLNGRPLEEAQPDSREAQGQD